MSSLNYHHLQYFWTIARAGSVASAAARLHVTASALSIQLRQLEDRLGQPLFTRHNRQLTLTEAGRIALDYADTIFKSGDELLAVLRGRPADNREIVRIGAAATLSRNFQYTLLRPLLGEPGVELVLRSGSMSELLAQLDSHALDMLLSNMPVPRDAGQNRHSHLLADVAVSLVSRRSRGRRPFRFPDDLATTALLTTFFALLIIHMPTKRGEHEGAQFAEFGVRGSEELFLEHLHKEALHIILRIARRGTAASAPGIQREPIRRAELLECPPRLLILPLRLDHEAPAGRFESSRRGLRHWRQIFLWQTVTASGL